MGIPHPTVFVLELKIAFHLQISSVWVNKNKKLGGGGGVVLDVFSFAKMPSLALDHCFLLCVLRSGDDKDEIVKEWKTKSRGGEGGQISLLRILCFNTCCLCFVYLIVW